MRLLLRIAMSAVLGALMAGCLTIRKDAMQSVTFVSSPPGARLTIDATGGSITTPGHFDLKRDHNHVVVAEKDGYESQTMALNRDVSTDIYMNFICLSLCPICFAVDFISGDAYELKPNPVIITLVPAHTAPAPATAPEPPP